jgi:hypothetical protein
MTAPRDIRRPLRRSQAPELSLAARGAACAAVTAVPVVGVATLVRGLPGLLGAGLAAGLVVGLFALAGIVLACVARRSPARLPAVSFVGAILRMIAYGALLTALAGVDGIDRASTAVATCLLLVVTLVYEARFAATAPGYYWLLTPAPHGAPANERTQG